jgi:hypothetical protein
MIESAHRGLAWRMATRLVTGTKPLARSVHQRDDSPDVLKSRRLPRYRPGTIAEIIKPVSNPDVSVIVW